MVNGVRTPECRYEGVKGGSIGLVVTREGDCGGVDRVSCKAMNRRGKRGIDRVSGKEMNRRGNRGIDRVSGKEMKG